MGVQEGATHYQSARRLGMKEHSASAFKGQTGYLPFLEGLLKNVDIVSEVSLGTVDVPLKNIIGTLTHARSLSFARNYMPLMDERTEFGQKWINLCEAHLSDGLRDPLKVYEYLNWFYVVEGNKRVSVLKFFNAHSFHAEVTRLIPKRDNSDLNIRIYYEFMEFYKKTGINCIWFSKEGSFESLWKYIEKFESSGLLSENKYKLFANAVYQSFRRVYHQEGGRKLVITTGDAFLEYIRLYGIPMDIDEATLGQRLKRLMTELDHFANREEFQVQTEPSTDAENKLLSTLTTLVKPKRKLKVAFAYAKTIQESNWSYSHDWGRKHIEKVMKATISTSYIENVPENLNAYDYLKRLANEGNDVIFSTSPAFINATLKTALEFPSVKFFNCSQTKSFKHVNTYFGRIYESRFLAGVIAGSLTGVNVVGYVGTHPISEVISGINAFALGARLVNPRVIIKVAWMNEWDSQEKSRQAASSLIHEVADIISHHNTLGNRDSCKDFGLYSVVCNVDKENCVPNEYLAAPVWNWGIFYEKIITCILNDTWRGLPDIFGFQSRLINFWWGMDSGIVDIFYSTKLVPGETQKLIRFLKRMIESNTLHPFTGPIYDQKGVLRIKRDEIATHEQILSMDWFVDAVDTRMPKIGRRKMDAELYIPVAENSNE